MIDVVETKSECQYVTRCPILRLPAPVLVGQGVGARRCGSAVSALDPGYGPGDQ